MDWEDHQRWAKKFGISDEAVDFVNKVIDLTEEHQLPNEYIGNLKATAEEIAENEGANHGNSALAEVITRDTMKHDAGRRKQSRGTIAASCELRILRQMGEGVVDAWYLHHYLDYLNEQRPTGANLTELLSKYRNDYPEACSAQIERFLLEHSDLLVRELAYTD